MFFADHDETKTRFRIGFHSVNGFRVYNGLNFEGGEPHEYSSDAEAIAKAGNLALQELEKSGVKSYPRSFSVTKIVYDTERNEFSLVLSYDIPPDSVKIIKVIQ